MKRVLVTGCAGFIGLETTLNLLNKNYSVVGVDNLNDYYDVRLKKYRLEELEGKQNFDFKELDIEDIVSLEGVFKNSSIDAVINLAARAGVQYSLKNPHVYLSTNAHGCLNVLEMMRRYDVPKLVLASTSSLYAGQPVPFSEDLPVNTPISPYAATKKAAEVMAYTYHYLFGIDVSIVRYFTVFGPAGRPDMSVFRFIKWIDEGIPIELFGDGTQTRDFTYIDDIAEGTVKALKMLNFEIINLGGGRNPVSINEIIKKIEDNLAKKATVECKPFQKEDMLQSCANIQKAQRLLGWSPRVNVDEGIRRTVQWYAENRSWLRDIEI